MPRTKSDALIHRLSQAEDRLKVIKRMIGYGGDVNIIREAWIRLR